MPWKRALFLIEKLGIEQQSPAGVGECKVLAFAATNSSVGSWALKRFHQDMAHGIHADLKRIPRPHRVAGKKVPVVVDLVSLSGEWKEVEVEVQCILKDCRSEKEKEMAGWDELDAHVHADWETRLFLADIIYYRRVWSAEAQEGPEQVRVVRPLEV